MPKDKKLVWIIGIVAGVVVLCCCGAGLLGALIGEDPDPGASDATTSDTSTPTTTTETSEPSETTSETTSASPSPEEEAVTDEELTAYLEEQNGGRTIEDSCDGSDLTKWQCYFDSFEVRNESSVLVNLSTPGDTSGDEQKSLAEDAGRWVKNMMTLTDDAPMDLDTVVVYVNGVDQGTTRV